MRVQEIRGVLVQVWPPPEGDWLDLGAWANTVGRFLTPQEKETVHAEYDRRSTAAAETALSPKDKARTVLNAASGGSAAQVASAITVALGVRTLPASICKAIEADPAKALEAALEVVEARDVKNPVGLLHYKFTQAVDS